jgi:hypothetical protein
MRSPLAEMDEDHPRRILLVIHTVAGEEMAGAVVEAMDSGRRGGCLEAETMAGDRRV